MDAFTGEIRMFPINYAPQNWEPCDGREINVAQNPALYAVIGTTYGGTPGKTFKLPNLQQVQGVSAAPIGAGAGPGLTPWTMGPYYAGQSTVILKSTAFLPAHTHDFTVTLPANTATNLTGVPDQTAAVAREITSILAFSTVAPDRNLDPGSVGYSGGTGGAVAPHNNCQPYLAINFFICLDGYFPVHQ